MCKLEIVWIRIEGHDLEIVICNKKLSFTTRRKSTLKDHITNFTIIINWTS
jgi:hypothetical protein